MTDARAVSRHHSPVTTRARIALIEDNSVLVDLIEKLLIEEGFEVFVCSSSRDSHAFVAQSQPDLVLLDLQLADVEHGGHVLDALTRDPATRRIPIILWSGAHDAVQERAPAVVRHRAMFVVPAPFGMQTLLQTIEQALAEYPPLLRLDGGCLAGDSQADVDLACLTAREMEVAQLISRGYSNRQIAEVLVVTPGTVANHVAHILDKLAYSSRVQVAVRVTSRRPLEDPEDNHGSSRVFA